MKSLALNEWNLGKAMIFSLKTFWYQKVIQNQTALVYTSSPPRYLVVVCLQCMLFACLVVYLFGYLNQKLLIERLSVGAAAQLALPCAYICFEMFLLCVIFNRF